MYAASAPLTRTTSAPTVRVGARPASSAGAGGGVRGPPRPPGGGGGGGPPSGGGGGGGPPPPPRRSFGMGRLPRRSLGEGGPFERRAVRVGRIGCGDGQHFGGLGRVAKRSQQLERGGLRELRRADADEIAAPHAPGILERLQHVVDRAESAEDALSGRDLARHYTVAREQLLRHRGGPLRVARRGRDALGEQRPAPFAGRRRDAAAAERRR